MAKIHINSAAESVSGWGWRNGEEGTEEYALEIFLSEILGRCNKQTQQATAGAILVQTSMNSPHRQSAQRAAADLNLQLTRVPATSRHGMPNQIRTARNLALFICVGRPFAITYACSCL
jgi:hypothetical protein